MPKPVLLTPTLDELITPIDVDDAAAGRPLRHVLTLEEVDELST